MRLTLCLPGLLLPRQALLDTVADLELPALSGLLGRGRLHRDAPAAHHDRLMQRWTLAYFRAPRRVPRGGPGGGGSRAGPANRALRGGGGGGRRAPLAPLFADLGERRRQ